MDGCLQRSETVDLILAEMRRNGLNDARGKGARAVDLQAWVRGEVMRALERAARDDPPIDRKAIEKDRRRAAGLCNKMLAMESLRPLARPGAEMALRALRAARWVPSSRQDGVAYKCALEAYDLIDIWTNKRPTGYESGPFREITRLICEHVGHRCDEKRACDNALKNKNRYG